jgi:hypothetical protein
MLALKKKREAEKKAAEEAAAAAATAVSSPPSSDIPPPAGDTTASGDANSRTAVAAGSSGQVSLFGIGGQKKTKKGDPVTGTKKTPGEIRIQKGKSLVFFEMKERMIPFDSIRFVCNHWILLVC